MAIPVLRKELMRKFKTFDLWNELWDDSDYGGDGEGVKMESYRNKNGSYIEGRYRGRRPGLVKIIAKLEISPIKISSKHSVCSIGKSAVDGKWYGWSHRAMMGFGIGDKVFEERFNEGKLCRICKGEYRDGEDWDTPCLGEPCPSSVPFVRHGRKTIKTDKDAKAAAIAFARYVS